jgi:beta-glucanase (GH16 family)
MCGEEVKFTALNGGKAYNAAKWTLLGSPEGCALSASGVFTAGETTGVAAVKAEKLTDSSITAVATVTVTARPNAGNPDDPDNPVDPDDPPAPQDPEETNPDNYFYDGFSGGSLDLTKWTCQLGTKDTETNGPSDWGNGEAQYYKSENAVVSDGTLKIAGIKENAGSKQYTSARIITRGKFSHTYGRFEARIKLPAGQGWWPAFWLLPEKNTPYGGWPMSGEIDIMEAKGRIPGRTSAALHFGVDGGDQYVAREQTFPAGGTIAEFHVYAVEWTGEGMRFYVDDRLFLTVTEWVSKSPFPAPFDTDFYILINLAVGGHFDGYLLPAQDLGVMEVDYVKVSKI